MSGSETAQQARLDKEREANERRLVEAAQQDHARFVDLYEEYFDVTYAYIARRTRNRDDAEDLTAEVFRRALQSLPRFKWTGKPFAAWLFRIASNLIADRAKRAKKETAQARSEAEQPPATRSSQPRNQQSTVEEAEGRARLFGMLRELAADQRRVIVMRFAEEKSIRDIAAEIRRTEGAVKQLQFRALENLRKMISQSKSAKR